MFVKTQTILDQIMARKLDEIADSQRVQPLAAVRHAAAQAAPPRDLAAALRRDTVALIAEVKKASPSKGVLMEDFDPVRLAGLYTANGAAAVSVLTDETFFQGHLEHLRAVRAVVEIPVLRKEFILDPYQVYEARAAGADAVLLIAAALDDAQMSDLNDCIVGLGMSPLVEVHDEAEMQRALKLSARLIGINNRNLMTFQEDLTTTSRLAAWVTADVTLVAESAIRSLEDVRHMGRAGAHAVLVGEGLVKSADIGAQVRAFSTQPRVQG
jgi:indole-3-glycerol phosphate synthase